MSNNKVTNVADPTANGDAVNYKTMNAMKTDLESQIENLSGLLDTANQKIQDLEQRVEELENNPPQPVDPAAKFVTVTGLNGYSNEAGTPVHSFDTLNEALERLGSYSTRYFYKINGEYFATNDEIVNGKTYASPNELTISGATIKHTAEGYTVFDAINVSYIGTAHY